MFIQFIMICICMLTINMLMNLKIKNNEKKDEKISTKNVADICRLYSKKGCSNLNDLSYDKDGGKENFHSKVNDVINSLNNITLQENVYILDVVNDLKKSDIRGYVLINNVKQKT